MFIMRAPYPAVATTTAMPSPKFSDSQALGAIVQRMRAMDGTLYTYVNSKNGRKIYQWSFELARNKALEVREFINAYFGYKIQITDHNNTTIIGYLKNNPFDFEGAGRAGPNWPGEETMTVTLEFEEA